MAHRDVLVDWRLKALAFRIFDSIPFGESLYYLLQKNVTRTIPRKLFPTSTTARDYIQNIKAIRRFRDDVHASTLLEIGAGWDLYGPLIYYCMGIDDQISIDIRRWARADAVNSVILHLQQDPPEDHVRVPKKLVRNDFLDEDLKSEYGIKYLAPFDAINTGLDSCSVDIITTRSVFEHIPLYICRDIIAEFRRIIRDDGIMCHIIDYSDHYSHADSKINVYNYLRFDDLHWKLFNPGIHFQNRARTPQFVELFKSNAFEIVVSETWSGSEEELESIPLSSQFNNVERQELLELGGQFIIRPIKTPDAIDFKLSAPNHEPLNNNS